MPQDPTENEEIGELDVSEYITLLLAWDTYYRYLKETTGTHEPADQIAIAGVGLLRRAELQSGDAFKMFLDEHLPTDNHKKMLAKAWRFALTRDGLPRKALQIRTLMSRGGASTMRKVFKTNKALQQVRAAMAAAMIDDADAALDKFAVIQVRNMRIRTWIDKAAEAAGPGTVQNAVDNAQQSSDDSDKILAARIQQAAGSPTSQSSADAGAKQEELLAKVQVDAQEAAQKSLQVMGEADEPPKKSEVIAIATAAAVAAATDPSRMANIPSGLKGIANDGEQLVAAMSMGKVVVAANAGSGKTTTLTSRIAYLVNDLNVSPNKIFACAFNRKAADEMKERIAQKTGTEATDQMSVGTMHSLFKRFIVEYGNPEEKAAMTTWLMSTPKKGNKQQIPSRAPSPGAMMGYMGRIWKECFNEDPPRRTGTVIQAWMMNHITPEMAKAQATSPEEEQQAVWYEWFLGFKGVTKGWTPPCARDPKAGKQWGEFLAKWRDNGKARLGDFSDMLLMFESLLEKNPAARKRVQDMFDHLAADEAQDLNEVQHRILELMSEHVGPNSVDKSILYIGDDLQCINRFTGARPELFANLTKRPDFKTYKITTNYRCLPEIVETANTLMSHHPQLIEKTARVDATKPRGDASIVVQNPDTHAAGAIQTITRIKQDVDSGSNITDYAVLTRTNMEQNDYETACIIAGIPYGRKGGTSFLKSPETVTVMCYFNLVVGQDFERMQKSLVEVLDKPRRFFLAAGQAEQVVSNAVRKLAQVKGVSTTAINPLDLFDDTRYLLEAMNSRRDWPNWRVQQTQEQIENMGYELRGMRKMLETKTTDPETGEDKPYTTQSLIGDILAVRGKAEKYGQPEPTLREVLMPAASMQEEEADDPSGDEEEEAKKAPIGNVQFLFQIAQPKANSPDEDPSNPLNFKAHIDGLANDAKDLRVDLDAWSVAQSKLDPSKRTAPPCVVLSTVHSVKGAQWNNTTVVMAGGVFPMAPRKKKNEDQLTDEQRAALAAKREAEFLTERQLAYVAMTRAAKGLTVVCPDKSVYGRDAGLSIFVSEAGLNMGQNVEGKNDPTPSDENGQPIKTASFSELRDEAHSPEVLAYDRRG